MHSTHHSQKTRSSQRLPFFIHRNGQWCRKVRGRHYYFGSVRDDPDGQRALQEWLRVKDYLLAGLPPPPPEDTLDLDRLCNQFLHVKRQLVDGGELSIRTWLDYRDACRWLIDTFGRTRSVGTLAPADFERLRTLLAARYSPYRTAKLIGCIRSVFRYGYEAGLIDKPVRFGPTFKRPSVAVYRRLRAQRGPRCFTREQVRSLIEHANAHLKAFILLGINAGLGPADIGRLRPEHITLLSDGWAILDYPRPKTGVPRRAFIWPETVHAMRLAVQRQPRRKADARGLMFCTATGRPWYKPGNTSLSSEFAKLRVKAQIPTGLSFYHLRHTLRTVLDETGDYPAIDLVMGHADQSMGGVYRQRIDDSRLRRLAEHVRRWLFEEQDQ